MFSYRRILLDKDLEEAKGYMKGIVLDVGGGRKRGLFTAPCVPMWIVLDSGREFHPDIQADAQYIPVKSQTLDCVKCTELLEHVEYPEKVLDEISRILKPDGTLILSVPFNCNIHADPYDFQRFTDQKLIRLLRDNFRILSLKKQGLYFNVLADMIRQAILHYNKRIIQTCFRLLLPVLNLVVKLDNLKSVQNSKLTSSYTTGFFVVAFRK
jgi:SAM-dependent methyltransferase